jgi:hypothetical protein
MSGTEALRDGAKKVTDNTRQQVHVYVGANDYFYEQARRRASTAQSRRTLKPLTREGGRSQLASPKKLRETIHDRMDASRNRRAEYASRGEAIARDWHSAVAVQDATSLIKVVREAEGTRGLATGLRGWLRDFPADNRASGSKPKPTKQTATKRASTKRATTKPAARKPAAQKATS